MLRIGRYIARDNPVAARIWVERLRQKAALATKSPKAGRIVPEYSQPELREILVRNYRIVYRVCDDAIKIITVFEGHLLFPEDAISDDDE
ncbi:MAG: type II toxin-antitoxin system RelE/ParE family toxin [Deltaproteobacteria bacterium]|nr:type II toxin-antitoxin system RelE/ParE family toxin [Deltaproteobacteria bacterium]